MPSSLGEHLALLSVKKELAAVLGPGSSLVGDEGLPVRGDECSDVVS